MSLFSPQRVYCPACGTLLARAADLEHVLSLCCDDDCREAMRLAHARYVTGTRADGSPYAELLEHRAKK